MARDAPRDDVQLSDLEVVQRWSLAVRSATAPRAELVAALESDLAWLTASAAPATRPRRRAAAPDGAAAGAAAPRGARRAPAGSARRPAPERPSEA
jgi:hypothetical protein